MTGQSSLSEYEEAVAASRDRRMAWWRAARFGMFVHFGLYALLGRNEWAMALENYPVAEYEALARDFHPQPGAPREWARLAKAAGMRYMVLTTRHHEGFSLWDSETNPYNSVNVGPKRDLVREFVEACREYDLKIGFYSSLMDWHHPDGGRAAYDPEARARFVAYIHALNRELMTQYGKIDILWYDVPQPMQSWEGWDALTMNQMVRALQPEIIINNRSRLEEDFGTPEEQVTPLDRDWEACMTFNGLSWGYVDSRQAAAYSYNASRIIRMLNTVTAGGGNLLLNIGPAPDGSVPAEVQEPLQTVGRWLQRHGAAVYGPKQRSPYQGASGVCGTSYDPPRVYVWNWIWPQEGELVLGGFSTPVKAVRIVDTDTPVAFEQAGHRIRLRGLPDQSPDEIAGIAVLEVEFDGPPAFHRASAYPQLHQGRSYEREYGE